MPGVRLNGYFPSQSFPPRLCQRKLPLASDRKLRHNYNLADLPAPVLRYTNGGRLRVKKRGTYYGEKAPK